MKIFNLKSMSGIHLFENHNVNIVELQKSTETNIFIACA